MGAAPLPGPAGLAPQTNPTGAWRILKVTDNGTLDVDYVGGDLLFTAGRLALGAGLKGEYRATIARYRIRKVAPFDHFDLSCWQGDKQVTLRGIIRIQGDLLEICIGEKERPVAFLSQEGSFLIMARRARD
jgi:hypothetical protein